MDHASGTIPIWTSREHDARDVGSAEAFENISAGWSSITGVMAAIRWKKHFVDRVV